MDAKQANGNGTMFGEHSLFVEFHEQGRITQLELQNGVPLVPLRTLAPDQGSKIRLSVRLPGQSGTGTEFMIFDSP